MDVVKFFGQLISEKTGIKLIHSTGMIRLALRDMQQDREMSNLSDIKLLLNKYLKNRLERAGLKDRDTLISFLESELMRNQSLLVMGA